MTSLARQFCPNCEWVGTETVCPECGHRFGVVPDPLPPVVPNRLPTFFLLGGLMAAIYIVLISVFAPCTEPPKVLVHVALAFNFIAPLLLGIGVGMKVRGGLGFVTGLLVWGISGFVLLAFLWSPISCGTP